MGSTNQESERRVVISSDFVGNVVPMRQVEMDRPVHLLDGARIKGGVYAGDVSIEGRVEVGGPISSRRQVRIVPGGQAVTIRGGIKARRSLLVEPGAGSTTIFGDVYAASVNLTRTQVLGTVHATGEVRLRDCIVVGFVMTQGDLFMATTSVVSFKARSARLGPGVSLWLPAAFAESGIELEGHVRCGMFSVQDECPPGAGGPPGFHCRLYQAGRCEGCHLMRGQDVHDSHISAEGKDGRFTFKALSLVPRVLDTSDAREAMEKACLETAGRLALRGA